MVCAVGGMGDCVVRGMGDSAVGGMGDRGGVGEWPMRSEAWAEMS